MKGMECDGLPSLSSLTASRQVGARGRSPSGGGFRLTQYGISPFEQSVTTFASVFSRGLTHPGSPTAFQRLVNSNSIVVLAFRFAYRRTASFRSRRSLHYRLPSFCTPLLPTAYSSLDSLSLFLYISIE